jgi:hypothetical protein
MDDMVIPPTLCETIALKERRDACYYCTVGAIRPAIEASKFSNRWWFRYDPLNEAARGANAYAS